MSVICRECDNSIPFEHEDFCISMIGIVVCDICGNQLHCNTGPNDSFCVVRDETVKRAKAMRDSAPVTFDEWWCNNGVSSGPKAIWEASQAAIKSALKNILETVGDSDQLSDAFLKNHVIFMKDKIMQIIGDHK